MSNEVRPQCECIHVAYGKMEIGTRRGNQKEMPLPFESAILRWFRFRVRANGTSRPAPLPRLPEEGTSRLPLARAARPRAHSFSAARTRASVRSALQPPLAPTLHTLVNLQNVQHARVKLCVLSMYDLYCARWWRAVQGGAASTQRAGLALGVARELRASRSQVGRRAAA